MELFNFLTVDWAYLGGVGGMRGFSLCYLHGALAVIISIVNSV